MIKRKFTDFKRFKKLVIQSFENTLDSIEYIDDQYILSYKKEPLILRQSKLESILCCNQKNFDDDTKIYYKKKIDCFKSRIRIIDLKIDLIKKEDFRSVDFFNVVILNIKLGIILDSIKKRTFFTYENPFVTEELEEIKQKITDTLYFYQNKYASVKMEAIQKTVDLSQKEKNK